MIKNPPYHPYYLIPQQKQQLSHDYKDISNVMSSQQWNPSNHHPNGVSSQCSIVSNANDDLLTLCNRLRSQVEYYFSAQNLATDVYLQTVMLQNQGRVPTSLIANFPKIQRLHHRCAASRDCVDLLRKALATSHVVCVEGDHLIPLSSSLPGIMSTSEMDEGPITSTCYIEARNIISSSGSYSSSSSHDESDWTNKEQCTIKTTNNNTVSTCSPTSFSSETVPTPSPSCSAIIVESSEHRSSDNDPTICLQNLKIGPRDLDRLINYDGRHDSPVSSPIVQCSVDPGYHSRDNGAPIVEHPMTASCPPIHHYYPQYYYPQQFFYSHDSQVSNPLCNSSNAQVPAPFYYYNYYYNYSYPMYHTLSEQTIAGYASNHHQQLLVNTPQISVLVNSPDSQSNKGIIDLPGDIVGSVPPHVSLVVDTPTNGSHLLPSDVREHSKPLLTRSIAQSNGRLQPRGKRNNSNRGNNRKKDRIAVATSNSADAGTGSNHSIGKGNSSGRSAKTVQSEKSAKEQPSGKKKRNKKAAGDNDFRKNGNQFATSKLKVILSDENFPALVPGSADKLVACKISNDVGESTSSSNGSFPKKTGYAEALVKQRMIKDLHAVTPTSITRISNYSIGFGTQFINVKGF